MNNFHLIWILTIPIFLIGCRQPAYGPNNGLGGAYGAPNQFAQNDGQSAELARQIQELNQRIGSFDSDNHDLQTVVASLQQKLQISNDMNAQLRMQLKETADRLEQSMLAQQTAEQRANQVSSSAAQYTQFNGATVRAINGLMTKLPDLTNQGIQARMDGDVIRIEIPTEQLFVSGTYQISSSANANLSMIVSAIRRSFSHQIIGVEAHWDGTPIEPATITEHQLTATQALALFNHLQRSGIPQNQMFTMALGSNRPRYQAGSGNTAGNRRVEIVIYPETYDGS
jgi:flagellar motor protein MotB